MDQCRATPLGEQTLLLERWCEGSRCSAVPLLRPEGISRFPRSGPMNQESFTPLTFAGMAPVVHPSFKASDGKFQIALSAVSCLLRPDSDRIACMRSHSLTGSQKRKAPEVLTLIGVYDGYVASTDIYPTAARISVAQGGSVSKIPPTRITTGMRRLGRMLRPQRRLAHPHS